LDLGKSRTFLVAKFRGVETDFGIVRRKQSCEGSSNFYSRSRECAESLRVRPRLQARGLLRIILLKMCAWLEETYAHVHYIRKHLPSVYFWALARVCTQAKSLNGKEPNILEETLSLVFRVTMLLDYLW
jgi:hypothetical protein